MKKLIYLLNFLGRKKELKYFRITEENLICAILEKNMHKIIYYEDVYRKFDLLLDYCKVKTRLPYDVINSSFVNYITNTSNKSNTLNKSFKMISYNKNTDLYTVDNTDYSLKDLIKNIY
jgi:hypothetical protein